MSWKMICSSLLSAVAAAGIDLLLGFVAAAAVVVDDEMYHCCVHHHQSSHERSDESQPGALPTAL